MKRICFYLIGCTFANFTCSEARKYTAIVVDGDTHSILYGYKENEPCHPASLTKKMTLYILFEALANKQITLNTQFPVSSYAASQAPSKLGVPAGQMVSVEVIIKSLVTRSANDMSVVAAEGLKGSVAAFVAYMNKKAKQIGMNNSVFYNPNGLPDKRHTSSAYDMAILGIALYRDFPQFTHFFKMQSFNYRGNVIKTHNHMIGSFQGLDGIKTGYTNASGFNISTSAVRYDADGKPHRLFAVVMGGDTWRNRDRKAAEILEAGFSRVGIQGPADWQQQTVEETIDEVIEATPSAPVEYVTYKNRKTPKDWTSPKRPKDYSKTKTLKQGRKKSKKRP